MPRAAERGLRCCFAEVCVGKPFRYPKIAARKYEASSNNCQSWSRGIYLERRRGLIVFRNDWKVKYRANNENKHPRSKWKTNLHHRTCRWMQDINVCGAGSPKKPTKWKIEIRLVLPPVQRGVFAYLDIVLYTNFVPCLSFMAHICWTALDELRTCF